MIMRLPAVLAATGLSRATIYAHMAQGIFPRSIPLGPKARGWLAEEVEAWKRQRIEARDTAPKWPVARPTREIRP